MLFCKKKQIKTTTLTAKLKQQQQITARQCVFSNTNFTRKFAENIGQHNRHQHQQQHFLLHNISLEV